MLWWLVALAAGGCAPHKATLQVFRPAQQDLAGVERVAVLDFHAPAGGAEEARQAIVSRFAENRSYTLVEPAVLAAMAPITSPDGKTDRQAALDAARRAGVDALLEGKVGWHKAMTAGSQPSSSLKAELIDVRSGEVIAAETISRNGSQAGLDYDAALALWSDEVAQDLVVRLAPHYEEIEVRLARQRWGEGRAPVAAGNTLARQGEWIAAAEEWEQARRANPGNHAALHNLALIAEARQDYRLAFKLLDQALAQFPAKLYHQTRKEMEARQTTFLRALEQIEAIRAASLAHSAPPGVVALPSNQ
jgi:tetratricopeptide (TPR) repeat protein